MNTIKPKYENVPISIAPINPIAAFATVSFQKFNINPTNVNIHPNINDVSIVTAIDFNIVCIISMFFFMLIDLVND